MFYSWLSLVTLLFFQRERCLWFLWFFCLVLLSALSFELGAGRIKSSPHPLLWRGLYQLVDPALDVERSLSCRLSEASHAIRFGKLS